MKQIKQKQKFLLSIIFIILFISLINYFGVFKKGGIFTITEITTDEGTIVNQDYFCPSSANHCIAKGIIECTESSGEKDNVIFRTNSNSADGFNNAGTWIAINGIPSGNSFIKSNLKGYCRSTSVSSNAVFINRLTPSLNRIGVWNSVIYIETKGNWRKYLPCDSADLTPNPKQPYTLNNQELTEGKTTPYLCNGKFKVGGVLRDSPTYSNNYPGNKSTILVKDIQPNQRVELDGGDNNYINYKVIEEQEICSYSFCNDDKSGYTECDNGIPGKFVPCDTSLGYKCFDGLCKSPFQSTNIEIKNSNGLKTKGFTSNEPINIDVNIVSEFKDMNVKLEIRENTPQGNIVETQNKNIKSGITTRFSFPDGIKFNGKYYIVLKIDAGLKDPFFYGTNSGETIYFKISTEINAQFQDPYQILNDVQTSFVAYTGYPIYVKYLITEPGGQPTLPDNVNVYAKLNDLPIKLNNPEIKKGTYKYSLILNKPGDLEFFGTATKGGFTTILDSTNIRVEQDTINVDWTKKPNFIKIGDTATFEFTTKNANGDLITTSNKIEVHELGELRDDIIPKGDGGRYSFNYRFTKRGDYEFLIHSTKYGIISPKPLSSGLINSGDIPTPDCVQDSECGFLKQCSESKCEIKIGELTLIIGSFFFLVLIIIILITFIKKKNKPNFGGL